MCCLSDQILFLKSYFPWELYPPLSISRFRVKWSHVQGHVTGLRNQLMILLEGVRTQFMSWILTLVFFLDGLLTISGIYYWNS